MSTYGKKALIKWDYLTRESLRFNHTNIDTQLSILQKWYPIGMQVNIWSNIRDNWNNYDRYSIIGYRKQLTHYMIEIINKDNVVMGLHPINIKPTDEWIKVNTREDKLNDLLG